MTLDEAQIIFDRWAVSPPAHHMMQILARLWGWKPPRGKAPDPAIPIRQQILTLPGLPVRGAKRDPRYTEVGMDELDRRAGALRKIAERPDGR